LRASNGKKRNAGKGDERDKRGQQRSDGLAAQNVLQQTQKRARITAGENGAGASSTSETGGSDADRGVPECSADDLGGNKELNSESSSQRGVHQYGKDKEIVGPSGVNELGQTTDGGEDGGVVDKTVGADPSSESNTTSENNRRSGLGVETSQSSRSSNKGDDDQLDDDSRAPSDGGDVEGEGVDLEATIRNLTKQLAESKKRESTSALANGTFSLVDLSGVRATNRDDDGDQGAGKEELDVSSLGTVLTAGAAGLLKDVEFTLFVNRKAFRYAKYWVPARDAPVDSALALYFESNWYGDYVQRTLGRHPRFDDWWFHNGVYIRQRLNQKRTNNIGQLRKIFKGMFLLMESL
jgi:hypothetical protein